VTPEERLIPDEKLRGLVNLMSEVMAIQAMCQTLKQEGMEYENIDEHLVFFREVSVAIVDAMNRRLKEIGNYD
jgi:hypothetical protein